MSKLQKFLLLIIFVIFAFFHFYSLSSQEFVDDDAAPMILIDRMWDGVTLKDARFLAYPYLFYNEPYRSIFSGTLLHIFGPNRILLRLPSIAFGLATFCLLVWIFKKEKISSWIIVFSMFSYSISSLIINDRSGGGDAQARFLILLTGYLIYISSKQNNIKMLRLALISWLLGVLTMLDSIVLLPVIILVFLKKKLLIDKKTIYLFIGIAILLILYFSAWIIFPYLAYKFNFQSYLLNRGLFYYFSRIGESMSKLPFDSISALNRFTSIVFTLWIVLTSLLVLKIKKYLYIFLSSIFAWLAVILLNRSSSHIIIYLAFLFFQAVIVTDYFAKKNYLIKILTIILLSLITFTNSSAFFTKHFTFVNFFSKLEYKQNPACLDTSVVRIYKNHNKTISNFPCEASNVK